MSGFKGPIQVVGTVKDGRLEATNREHFIELIQTLSDGPYTITVRRAAATRSHRANSYYWVCVGIVADETGNTPEEIHEIAKAKFIPRAIALADGNGEIVSELVIGGTTTSLLGPEFYDYVQAFREWARDTLGVRTPDPDPGVRPTEAERAQAIEHRKKEARHELAEAR